MDGKTGTRKTLLLANKGSKLLGAMVIHVWKELWNFKIVVQLRMKHFNIVQYNNMSFLGFF